MKKAIAMKCDKEQFEVVKPKLLKNEIKISHSLSDFNNCPWLFNNWQNEDNFIGNSSSKNGMYGNREIHETWNEKIFLQACGIEVEETFTITKSKILEIASESTSRNLVMQEVFPSAFEPEKKELVVESGKWHYCDEHGKSVFFVTKTEGNNVYAYGINYKGIYKEECLWYNTNDTPIEYIRLATQQEVEEALKAEAVRRYKVGDCVKSFFHEGNPVLKIKETDFNINAQGGVNCTGTNHYMPVVYENGNWAEIIQPKKMTQAEIEKELGFNIEIV